MVSDNCKDKKSSGQSVGHKTCNSDWFFGNLVWLTTKEAARYLRKNTNAVMDLVYKKILRVRKLRRRLYFKREELDALIGTSKLAGGL